MKFINFKDSVQSRFKWFVGLERLPKRPHKERYITNNVTIVQQVNWNVISSPWKTKLELHEQVPAYRTWHLHTSVYYKTKLKSIWSILRKNLKKHALSYHAYNIYVYIKWFKWGFFCVLFICWQKHHRKNMIQTRILQKKFLINLDIWSENWFNVIPHPLPKGTPS